MPHEFVSLDEDIEGERKLRENFDWLIPKDHKFREQLMAILDTFMAEHHKGQNRFCSLQKSSFQFLFFSLIKNVPKCHQCGLPTPTKSAYKKHYARHTSKKSILSALNRIPVLDNVDRKGKNVRSVVCPIYKCYRVFQSYNKFDTNNKLSLRSIFFQHLVEAHTEDDLMAFGFRKDYLYKQCQTQKFQVALQKAKILYARGASCPNSFVYQKEQDSSDNADELSDRSASEATQGDLHLKTSDEAIKYEQQLQPVDYYLNFHNLLKPDCEINSNYPICNQAASSFQEVADNYQRNLLYYQNPINSNKEKILQLGRNFKKKKFLAEDDECHFIQYQLIKSDDGSIQKLAYFELEGFLFTCFQFFDLNDQVQYICDNYCECIKGREALVRQLENMYPDSSREEVQKLIITHNDEQNSVQQVKYLHISSIEQIGLLKHEFTLNKGHTPSKPRIDQLSAQLDLSTNQIQIWFSNRRILYQKAIEQLNV